MPTKSTDNRLARAMTAVIWPMARMLSLVINSTSRTLKRNSDPAAAGIVDTNRKGRRRSARP